MKKISTKISLFLLIGIIFTACNTVKRVPEGKRLLTKNEIVVNDQITKDEAIGNLLYQKPNSTILGYNLRLNLYNLAKQNPDSSFKAKMNANPKNTKGFPNYFQRNRWNV